VKRLKWKNELVQNAEEKLSRDGIPLPSRIKYVLDLISNAGFEPTSFVFRLDGLTCTSVFRSRNTPTQRSVPIGPREYGGVIGYHSHTTYAQLRARRTLDLLPPTLLVNLGFVSDKAVDSCRFLMFLSSSASLPSSSSPVRCESVEQDHYRGVNTHAADGQLVHSREQTRTE
jgi:hypothetical protein